MSINVYNCGPLNEKMYNNLTFKTDKLWGELHHKNFLSFKNGNSPWFFKWEVLSLLYLKYKIWSV